MGKDGAFPEQSHITKCGWADINRIYINAGIGIGSIVAQWDQHFFYPLKSVCSPQNCTFKQQKLTQSPLQTLWGAGINIQALEKTQFQNTQKPERCFLLCLLIIANV